MRIEGDGQTILYLIDENLSDDNADPDKDIVVKLPT